MEKETIEKLIVQFEQLDNLAALNEAKKWKEVASLKYNQDRVHGYEADNGELEAASESYERESGYQSAISKVLRELKAFVR